MAVAQYRFSKREKTMIGALIFIIVGLLWYQFIFSSTTSKISELDSQITTVNSQNTTALAEIDQLAQMKEEISAYKKAGKKKVKFPDYDNITPLTTRLNAVLATTSSYSISFDTVDASSTTVERGADISFGCSSLVAARKIMTKLENDSYACSLSVVNISNASATNSSGYSSNSDSSAVSVSLHAIFYENNTSA